MKKGSNHLIRMLDFAGMRFLKFGNSSRQLSLVLFFLVVSSGCQLPGLIVDLTLGIGDIIHGVKNKSPYEDIMYLNDTYTLEDVKTYDFELTCDKTVMRHVDPKLKEPYCHELNWRVKEELYGKFPAWKAEENQPDLKIFADMEAAWGGDKQKFKITVETIVHITVVRWGTVIAEYRLKWEWNSKSATRNLKMYHPDMTNDKAFKATLRNVVDAIVNFVAKPSSYKKSKVIEETEDY